MTRPRGYFEIASPGENPEEAALSVGDVVRIDALGVKQAGAGDAVEILGPLTIGTLTAAEALMVAGGPNVVLVVARKPGRVRLEIVFGPARDRVRTEGARADRAVGRGVGADPGGRGADGPSGTMLRSFCERRLRSFPAEKSRCPIIGSSGW